MPILLNMSLSSKWEDGSLSILNKNIDKRCLMFDNIAGLQRVQG